MASCGGVVRPLEVEFSVCSMVGDYINQVLLVYALYMPCVCVVVCMCMYLSISLPACVLHGCIHRKRSEKEPERAG